jgi:polyribonucleotide nucleotidyltransferase
MGENMFIHKSLKLNGKEISIETGKMAKQADGAVVVRCGETMVLVTAVSSQEPSPNLNFFPLSVEYKEKMYSVGKIPGGFLKREARPTDAEILTARLVDRPIRPLFPKNFPFETQVIAQVLSMDSENTPDVLAGVGASAALSISNIPFAGPISTVRVIKKESDIIVNPTFSQMEQCDIELIVAGSDDSIMMVEGEANEVGEDELLEVIKVAHEAIRSLNKLQNEIATEISPEKREAPELELPENLLKKVTDLATAKIAEAITIQEKSERNKALRTLRDDIVGELSEEYPEQEKAIASILHDIEKEKMRRMVLNEEKRLDGRGLTDIRAIDCEISALPRAHGSALFTRGQTQSLGALTLGAKTDEQIIDSIEGESRKKYTLHYNFPPFCTGEAKPLRGVSRREVGHGNLAERALKPVLPKKDFPYTIRIVSEVLESNGSSSMASVCAGSLSLMDGGVPVSGTVAGIAMGLIKEDEKVAILSDILGDEDHLGDMDFKVAGTAKGITAVQMDIKIDGISEEIMQNALAQAKEGRQHIMSKMEEVISAPKPELSKWAPRIFSHHIPVDKIGTIIGPGGKTIRSITEEHGVQIDIDETGQVLIFSADSEAANKALEIVKGLVAEPEIGKSYHGKVTGVKDFGCFVEFMPGKEGMCHISELELTRTNKVSDVVKEGDEIDVVVKGVKDGKVSLSRREFLKRQEKENN